MNKVVLIGRVGHTPKIKYSSSGVAICRLNVATSEKVKIEGEWTEETEWHDVIIFGQPAEFCQKYVGKGDLVSVEGRIKTRKYTGKDGDEKRKTEIISDSFQKEAGKPQSNEKPSGNTNAAEKPKNATEAKSANSAPVQSDEMNYDDDLPF